MVCAKWRVFLKQGLIPSLIVLVTLNEWLVLRPCPCKNRPPKFWKKIDCPHFFYTSQAIYAMNEYSLYFATFPFFYFFCRQVEKHTKPEIETPHLGVHAMLAKNSRIQQNNLSFSELLENVLFFPQN